LEIIEELKSSDEPVQFNDISGEDPSSKLQVKDSELTSEIIKASDDGKVSDAGDRNKVGKIDEASDLFNQAIATLVAIGADPSEIHELVELASRLEEFTERDMKAQYSTMRSTNKGRKGRFDPNDPFNR
jgi:predicted HAD superfamily Cof-like phosphohydrolase